MKAKIFLLVFIIVAVLIYTVVLFQRSSEEKIEFLNNMGDFILKSSAFKHGELIPSRYTCDGENINPLFEIKNVPQEVKSLILIMDDPNATSGGAWDHWLLWNINPNTQYIAEDNIPEGAVQGANSWGRARYGGPCPPKGSAPHRYMFKLYALGVTLDLPEGAGKSELLEAMDGHILGETVLMGMYGR